MSAAQVLSIAIASFSLLVAAAAFTYSRHRGGLDSYLHAVESLVAVKRDFAEQAAIFERHALTNPEIAKHVPKEMDPKEFLLFASAMWRFSFAYSVSERWQQLGMRESERDALRGEMTLWLQGLGGFERVYRLHTSKLNAHNREFVAWLSREVFGKEAQ
jgi:hypothetical protein